MIQTAAAIFLAIAASFSLFISSTSKSYYHSLFISTTLSDNASISHNLYMLTRRPHVAGTQANADAAAYVLSTLASCNIKSHIVSYDVSLTYPVSHVANDVLPTFHAYAKSGTITGPVAYVNYGRVKDYATLKETGVNLSGTVVLARYEKIYRGDIVYNAHEAGAIEAVIYTDRKDYGGGESGEGWFPEAKWMPPSGFAISDDKVAEGGYVPLIPSLPVSAAVGETIMRSIGGQVANEDGQRSKDGPTYKVGPGQGKQIIATVQNVIAVIEGVEEPDRFFILGNHRDAWTFGAVDPNSGTAALLEVAQRFAKLQKRGWGPRRTIILCNWDAEKYGLIGSTEWVEDNRAMLASRAVAYMNVDCAVAGAGFHAHATPQLDELLNRYVQDPDNSSQTIYELRVSSSSSPMIGRLGGAGSDYAAFVQHIGVPSADVSFGGGYPVYHSMYDDFVWMKKFGDPMFQRHIAVASVWGLVALQLADEEFLPFNYLSYANELQESNKSTNRKIAKDLEDEVSDKDINIDPLFKSIEELTNAATQIDSERKAIEESKGWGSIFKKDHLRVRELNDRLVIAERAFTDQDGLSRRRWNKHLIYASLKHNDYRSKSFPGIVDAIEKAKSLKTAESWHYVQHEVWRVSRAVRHASLVLSGELT
ncbi:dipeptidase, putative [Ricinus communis]|uniref:glutamate carboxypeptidase II n=1 Tax=Ricinus communis TaxID=3988 RepID=B9RKG5_RICCO|nr:dipeptidase, putative [Ricinus communis]